MIFIIFFEMPSRDWLGNIAFSIATELLRGEEINIKIKEKPLTSRKHAYISLTPLNPTFI